MLRQEGGRDHAEGILLSKLEVYLLSQIVRQFTDDLHDKDLHRKVVERLAVTAPSLRAACKIIRQA